MRKLAALGATLTSLCATPAAAHAGHDHAAPPGWTWDPWIVAPLALAALLFCVGWVRLYRRASGSRPLLMKRGRLFFAGWLAFLGALVSPLHEAGERSFAAHMVEHEVLMLLAAPLVVLAQPLSVMIWAFPSAARVKLGRLGASRPIAPIYAWASGAGIATLTQAGVLWIWHMPSLFDRALASESWHAAQHLSFVVSALLFWTATIGKRGDTPAGRAFAAFCLLATSLVTGALGALMAVSASPWYAGYARLGLAPFWLSPAEDQQVAGLIMWVPGGLVHLVVALALFRKLLSQSAISDAV